MKEHDRLRAQGIDPIAGLRKGQKRSKAIKSKPGAPGASSTGLTAAEERRRAAEKTMNLEKAVSAAQKQLAKLQIALAQARSEHAKLGAAVDRTTAAPSTSRRRLQDLTDELFKQK